MNKNRLDYRGLPLCPALFDSLAEVGRKYGLKWDELLADLELAAEEGQT